MNSESLWDRIINYINASISIGALMSTSLASLSLCYSISYDLSHGVKLILALFIVIVFSLVYMTVTSKVNDLFIEMKAFYNILGNNTLSVADIKKELSTAQLIELLKSLPPEVKEQVIKELAK